MNAMATPAEMVRDLRARTESIAGALIGREGRVLYADLPTQVYADTFAIMCAAVLGAAATANLELGRAPPTRIIAESPDSRTLLLACGRDAFLVLVTPASSDLESVESIASPFLESLRVALEREREADPVGRGAPESVDHPRRPRNR